MKKARLFLAVSCLAAAAWTQTYKTYDELPAMYHHAFKISAFFKQGHEENIEVLLETLSGYSVYRDSLQIKADNFEFRLKEGPTPGRSLDPVSRKIKEFYRDQNVFVYEYVTAGKAVPKEISFQLQACSKENCLLPVWVRLPVRSSPQASVTAAAPGDAPPEVSLQSGLAIRIKELFNNSRSLLSFTSLLILFLAGLLTAFSPCVLPLFPITLGIFSRWSHHNDRKAFSLSLSYGLGIIFCYAIHGLISAATGGVFGALTQSPAYLLSIGGVILISGFIFSGLLPFPFANFFMQLAGTVDTLDSGRPPAFKTLLFKSFVMGATLGLVASPCVGPILVTLLALLSRQLPQGDFNSYVAGFTALSVFGLGMAIPFLVLGHFYFRLHKRIQLGRFSPIAKYVGSALLMGASMFFIVPGFKILFPSKVPTVFKKYAWESRPAHAWLIVDFRADWCAACVEIESEVFNDPKVQRLIADQSWSLVQVDMTQPDAHADLAKSYDVISLPTVLFINPEGRVCKNLTLNEKESVENFNLRLLKAKRECF